ncbi:hypothetical protein HK096_002381 [Nowakowskiella sp. JEL0078]|nr:hypothetical protein HK096_002381 [Nowakowskiella sp. JEL0078]
MADSSGKSFDFGKIDSDLSADLYPLDRPEIDDNIQNYYSSATILKKLIKTQGISLMNHLQLKTILPRISGKYDDFVEIGRSYIAKAQKAFEQLSAAFSETEWESPECQFSKNSFNDFKRFCEEVLPFNDFWETVEFNGGTITEDELKRLKDTIDICHARQTWKVSSWKFSECTFAFMQDGVYNVELLDTFKIIDLESLHLNDNQIGPDELGLLLTSIKENHFLKHLSLESNRIFEKGTEHIKAALSDPTSRLTSLSLIQTDIDGDTGIQLIVEALRHNKTLENFVLEETELEDAGAKDFAVVIKENQTLKHLSITSTEITEDGFIELCDALAKNSTLESISFFDNNPSDDGAETIANALKTNTTLKKICLSYCGISAEGFESLFSVLADDNKSIEEIDFSSNFLGSTSDAFLELVTKNKSLKKINLKSTGVKDSFIEYFSGELGKNTSIVELDLSENYQITEIGFKSIAKSLLTNTSLENLDLSIVEESDHGIESGADAFVEALKVNTTIRKLSLAGWAMSQERAEQLTEIIMQKDKMSVLDTFLTSTSRYSYPLHRATEMGNLPIIRELLKKGFNIEGENDDGYRPLHIAIQKDQCEIVEALIEFGVDVDSKSQNGERPIHIALQNGSLEILELLLNFGANTNYKNSDGDTALLVALKMVVENQKSDNETEENEEEEEENESDAENEGNEEEEEEESDPVEETHTEKAIRFRQILEILFTHNVDSSLENDEGISAMHIAVEANSADLMELLMENNVAIDMKNKERLTPLHQAVQYKAVHSVEALVKKVADINALDKKRYSPLHFAASSGNLEIVVLLCENKADINAETASKETPLSLAALDGNIEIMEYLLKNGADVNGSYSRPIIQAAVGGHKEAINLLYEFKADVNATDLEGNTALHKCNDNNKEEIVQLLIDLGANVNAISKSGIPPFFTVIQANLEIFVRNGADLKIKSNSGQTVLDYVCEEESLDACKVLIEAGANVNTLFNSPMFTFIWSFEIVKLLLEHGADVNFKNNNLNGSTPILYAATYSNPVTFNLLLKAGADLNAVDNDGNGLMTYAIINSEEMIDVVRKLNFTTYPNKDGKMPIDIAREMDYESLEYLEKLGY